MSEVRQRSVFRESLVLERRSVLVALAASVSVSIATVALSGSAAWLIVRSAQRPALLASRCLWASFSCSPSARPPVATANGSARIRRRFE